MKLVLISSQLSIRLKSLLFGISFFACIPISKSQDCACTAVQVQNNLVGPCEITIGTVVTVSTAAELNDAINQANSSGGNMTILLEDGNYQVASTASFPYITADDVVFRSVSGNRDAVIISGGGMMPTSSTENGFLIAGNNVTIADLTIQDVGNHGIQVSGHHLFIHNIQIKDTYEQMLKGSTNATTIDSAIVQCSFFRYSAGEGPNYYIGGLDIHKGNGWTVRDNVFKFISSPSESVAEHAIHFWDNSMNNTVERNIIINCDRGIGFGLGENGAQNEGGIIKNNMIFNDGGAPFHDVGIGLESSPNTRVYNNTVFIEYQNAIEYRFTTTANVDIINNLTNKPITSRNGGTGNLQTNFTTAPSNWFINPTQADLNLVSGVPEIIDQGTSLENYVTVDMDKDTRPLNAGYEIGADEYLITKLNSIFQPTFFVFPNPSSTKTILKTGMKLNINSLSIYNSLGQFVRVQATFSDEEIMLQHDNLSNGIYLIVLKEDNKVIGSTRLIIQK